MPVSLVVFFVCWVVAALLCGAAIVFAWRRWLDRSEEPPVS